METFTIKSKITGAIMYEGEAESLKRYLEFSVREKKYLSGANLEDANLSGAYLEGANLEGAKGYSCNHCFFQEIVRRQDVSHFTELEWALAGKLMTHFWCWDTLTKTEHIDALTSILTKLSALGFGEFLEELNNLTKKG